LLVSNQQNTRLEQIEQDREKPRRKQSPAKSTQGSARFQVASNQVQDRILLEPVDAIRGTELLLYPLSTTSDKKCQRNETESSDLKSLGLK
jgi:hypothetical protein